MRFITLREALEVHRQVLRQSGGTPGLRDVNGLESALEQPLATFDGTDLYPSVLAKAAALAFFIIRNHPFIDGNKRVGHAAMEIVLVLNGFSIDADVDEQEQVVLAVASAEMSREQLTTWLGKHLKTESFTVEEAKVDDA